MHQQQVIEQLLAWIEQSLDQPLTLDDIAAKSGYSKWHLQRIFKQHTGHILGTYARRRRLTAAARELRLTGTSVACIADTYQFDSQQTFTRCFRKQFGLPPASYRRSQDWSSYGLQPPLRLTEAPLPQADIVTLPAMQLVGNTQRRSFALVSGILLVVVFGFRNIRGRLAEGSKTAVGGAILAAMNTASEYGFGAVIAALPGFLVLSQALSAIPNPLLNEAISVTLLAGITGSASGGMSIALAAMSDSFIAAAHAAHIPLEVLHRVASMASGGMDTLPHNGAVITLLAITGLSHRQAYGGIFAITLIKSAAVLFVIGVFYLTGIV